MSTYDLIMQEGMEKGMKKGMEKAIVNGFKKGLSIDVLSSKQLDI